MGRLLVWARSAQRRRSQPVFIIVMIMKLVSVRDDCVYCTVIIALLYECASMLESAAAFKEPEEAKVIKKN
jgi:hypothetical protein